MKVIAEITEDIQRKIEQHMKGWSLFFYPPKGQDYDFISPFFGHKWDGTPETLRTIHNTSVRINGKPRHALMVMQYDGEDRFVWCTWTKELYDCLTKVKHKLEPRYSENICRVINQTLKYKTA